MIVEKRDGTLWADIFWDDLSSESQVELLMHLGDNGNFDVFPLTSVNISREDAE